MIPFKLAYTIAHAFATEGKVGSHSLVSSCLPLQSSTHTFEQLSATSPKPPKSHLFCPNLGTFYKLWYQQAVPVKPGQQLPTEWNAVPPGAKFLKQAPVRIMGADEACEVSEVQVQKSGEHNPSSSVCTFGVFKHPASFGAPGVLGEPVA